MNATVATRSHHVHGRRFAAVAPMADDVVETVVDAAVVVEAPVAAPKARAHHVHGARFAAVAPLAAVHDVEADAVEAAVVVETVEAADHQFDDEVAVLSAGATIRVALNVRTGIRVVLASVDGERWQQVATVPVDTFDVDALMAVEDAIQRVVLATSKALPPTTPATFVAGFLEAMRGDIGDGRLWDRWHAASADVLWAPTLVPARRHALAV